MVEVHCTPTAVSIHSVNRIHRPHPAALQILRPAAVVATTATPTVVDTTLDVITEPPYHRWLLSIVLGSAIIQQQQQQQRQRQQQSTQRTRAPQSPTLHWLM